MSPTAGDMGHPELALVTQVSNWRDTGSDSNRARLRGTKPEDLPVLLGVGS